MLLFRGYGAVWLGRAGSASSTPVSGDRSGVTRLWLIDYYTKAFAKPAPKLEVEELQTAAEVLAPEVVEVRRAKREAVKAELAERNAAIPRVRELIERAEIALQNKSKAAVADLVRAALEYKPLVLDFTIFEAELKARRQEDEDDELLLFSMVL